MHVDLRKALANVSRLPAIVFILGIQLYQRTLSLDHGPLRFLYPHGYCRHQPTCSSYAIQMLESKPLFTAWAQIIRRLISCHPWTPLSDDRLQTIIENVDKHP